MALIGDRRQQGRQLLLIEAEGRQNPVHCRLAGRRHPVLQERSQSTGRANIDVSVGALLLQSSYGFAKSNRAAHDIPEIIVRQARQNGRLIAARQRQLALLARDRPHERFERTFRFVNPM